MNFEEEYRARLRRLVGETNDSVPVEVDNDWDYDGDFSNDRVTVLTVTTSFPGEYRTLEFRGLYAHDQLMKAVLEVEL